MPPRFHSAAVRSALLAALTVVSLALTMRAHAITKVQDLSVARGRCEYDQLYSSVEERCRLFPYVQVTDGYFISSTSEHPGRMLRIEPDWFEKGFTVAVGLLPGAPDPGDSTILNVITLVDPSNNLQVGVLRDSQGSWYVAKQFDRKASHGNVHAYINRLWDPVSPCAAFECSSETVYLSFLPNGQMRLDDFAIYKQQTDRRFANWQAGVLNSAWPVSVYYTGGPTNPPKKMPAFADPGFAAVETIPGDAFGSNSMYRNFDKKHGFVDFPDAKKVRLAAWNEVLTPADDVRYMKVQDLQKTIVRDQTANLSPHHANENWVPCNTGVFQVNGYGDAPPTETTQYQPGTVPTPCAPETSPFPFLRANTMKELRKPHSDLVLLAAYRGSWRNYPQNSMEALREAAHHTEIVEADIRTAKDDPVVHHDAALNRLTNGQGFLDLFTAREFTGLDLKDRFGDKTDIHPMTAAQLFQNYADDIQQADASKVTAGHGYVLALNLALRPAPLDHVTIDPWNVVKTTYATMAETEHNRRIAIGETIVYRIDAGTLPANPRDIDTLVQQHDNASLNILMVVAPDDTRSMDRYEAYKKNPHIVGLEINYPYRGATTRPFLLTDSKGATGIFSPYYQYPEGEAEPNATCCDLLNTDTDSSLPLDYRARWDWYVSQSFHGFTRQFRLYTTDRPDLLNLYLQPRGLRNTEYILPLGWSAQ